MQSTKQSTNGHYKTTAAEAAPDSIQPHDLDAEKGLIGCLIIDDTAVSRVADFLRPEHFYRNVHGGIYAAILALYHRDEPIDLLTLSAKLPQEDMDDLADFTRYVPTAMNAEYYGRIIEQLAARRALIRAGWKITSMGYDATSDLDEQLTQADTELIQLRNGRTVDAPPRPREYATAWLDKIDRLRDKGSTLLGLPSPWLDLDKLLSGFINGQLYYVGARPSMGKSSMLISLASLWAFDANKRVYFWSGEMDTDQVMNRIAAARTKIPLSKIRAADLTNNEHEQTTRLGGMVGDSSLIIDYRTGLRPSQVRAACHREYMIGGLDAILIDYIGLMTPDRYLNSQNAEMTETSRALVSLARSLNVPVIAASQLSRDLEKRADKRPQLSDLRDSGSLEQDGFAVMFLYRDDHYNPLSDRPGITELNVAKHRDGPVGTADLFWDAPLATLRNLERNPINLATYTR